MCYSLHLLFLRSIKLLYFGNVRILFCFVLSNLLSLICLQIFFFCANHFSLRDPNDINGLLKLTYRSLKHCSFFSQYFFPLFFGLDNFYWSAFSFVGSFLCVSSSSCYWTYRVILKCSDVVFFSSRIAIWFLCWAYLFFHTFQEFYLYLMGYDDLAVLKTSFDNSNIWCILGLSSTDGLCPGELVRFF